MNTAFGPIVTAMVTPFNKNGEVDYQEAQRLALHLLDHGTDTLVIAGTTGESPTLTHEEEFTLFKELKACTQGKGRIMAGTGSNCTRTAIASTQEAERLGVDSTLQVVPYYNKPSQEGLYQHFKAISENTQLPICLYNIPGRSGINMTPETIARLSELNNIVAIKEAAGSVEQVKKIRQLTHSSFNIYSGDDGLTLSFLQEGACGVVSVASHLVGPQIKEMIKLFNEGQLAAAKAIDQSLQD